MSGEAPRQKFKIKIRGIPPKMLNPPDKSASTPSPPDTSTSTPSPQEQTASVPSPPINTTSTPSPPGKSSFTESRPPRCSISAQHGTFASHPADTSSAPPDTPRRKTAPPQRSNSPTYVPVGPGPGAGTEPALSVPRQSQTHGGGIHTCSVAGGNQNGGFELPGAKWEEKAAPASDGGDCPVSLSPWGPEEELVATEVWNYNQSIDNPRKRSESPSEEE